MKKFLSATIFILSILVIAGFVIYAAAWFYMAREIQNKVDQIWDNQTGLIFSGSKPEISGFPAPPRLEYQGQITDSNGLVFELPNLVVQGFPLPGFAVSASAPQGLQITTAGFEKPVHLDKFYIQAFIPRDLPRDFTSTNLHVWRDAGHKIDIESFYLKRDNLIADGKGYLTLDSNLQPEGQLNTKLSGLDELLFELAQNGRLKKKDVLMAQSFLNLLSQKNSESGASFVPTTLRLQDGFVYLGPLKAMPIPELSWQP